jgi:probable HAF family extracellular repeat protein
MNTIFLASAILAAGVAATPVYRVTDLSQQGFVASKINGQAQYAGQLGEHAAVMVYGTVLDLGVLNGFDESKAEGFNDAGQVIGTSLTGGYTFNGRAFLWHDGTMTALDGDGASNTSAAFGINAAGQIVGKRSEIAAIWDHGTVASLGTFPNDYASYAVAINSFGQVAGVSRGGGGTHAFFYDHGIMTPAGDLDGYAVGETMALNDAGEVVGTVFNYNAQPYAWHAYVWRGGITTDLGVLQQGATWNVANAINNLGAIVGLAMFIDGDVSSHAFLYKDGHLQDLNSLIPAQSGWVLTNATSINDAGRIVGSGTLNGQDHTFLLTPVSAASFAHRR